MNSSSEFSISFPTLPLFTVAVRQRMWHFWPFFPPLAPFLVLLTGILGGVDRLLPPAAPILAKVMAALTGSLPEACHVAKSSNSLVVCGCSRPSS
jgi:hypothetical protein